MTSNSKKRSRKYLFPLIIVLIGLTAFIITGSYRIPLGPYDGQTVNTSHPVQFKTPQTISIATYNIHRGKGKDGIRDLSRIAQVLKDIDLAGLNEVGGPTFWIDSDQAAILGKQLNCGWLFAPNQKRWFANHFGNGLLTHVKTGTWKSDPLPYDSELSMSPRNLLTTTFTLNDTEIPLFITHIDLGKIRHDQLRWVFEKFNKLPRAVLLGDLNSNASDPVLTALLADPTTIDAIKTAIPDQNSPKRIDWILVRGLKVISGGMHPVGISDHPCYWVTLKLPDES